MLQQWHTQVVDQNASIIEWAIALAWAKLVGMNRMDKNHLLIIDAVT